MLTDEYRPKTWPELVGNEETIGNIRRCVDRAKAGNEPIVLLFAGPPGVGKTSAARLVAQDFGAKPFAIQDIPGGLCTLGRLRALQREYARSWMYDCWRIVVIDEVNIIGGPEENLLRTVSETLPKRVALILTCNTRPSELFGGNGAFGSRCLKFWFTSKGLATVSGGEPGPGALRLKAVAEAAGMNGEAPEYYAALLTACKGNIRDALSAVESGTPPATLETRTPNKKGK